MTNPDEHEFDERIRAMLGDAVSETPPPPELGHQMANGTAAPGTSRSNRWMIGGGLGLGAAAAIAALLVVVPGLNDQEVIQTPSEPVATTVPTTTPEVTTVDQTIESVAPATSVSPSPVVTPTPTSAPGDDGSAPFPEDQPTTTLFDEATSAPTPDTAPTLEPAIAPSIVEASPAGIFVDGALVSDVPASTAMFGPFGEIWFTPSPPESVEDFDWRPRSLDLATGEVTPIDVPTDDGHSIVLRDVAVVQDETVLLYVTSYLGCSNGADPLCLTTLRTFRPDTGVGETLAEKNDWEANYGQFQLGRNGVIFGNDEGLISNDPTFFNISVGVTPTLASLGLEERYGDCSDCPTSFTIDQSGAYVAWIDGPADAGRIVITELQTGERVEVAVDLGITEAIGPDMGVAGIEIVDGTIVSGRAVVNWFDPDAGVRRPVSIDLATGESTPLTPEVTVTIF